MASLTGIFSALELLLILLMLIDTMNHVKHRQTKILNPLAMVLDLFTLWPARKAEYGQVVSTPVASHENLLEMIIIAS